MAPGKFRVKFSNGKPCVEKNQIQNEQDKELDGKIVRQNESVTFVPNSANKYFDLFFESMMSKIVALRLSKKNTNQFFIISSELINATLNLCQKNFEKKIVNKSTKYFLKPKNMSTKKLPQSKPHIFGIKN